MTTTPDNDTILARIRGQLYRAGLEDYLVTAIDHPAVPGNRAHISGTIKKRAVWYLLRHKLFRKAPARLHPEVGKVRVEFRSLEGMLGAGSLQVVVGVWSGRYEADIDIYNPLQSVESLIRHNVEEVIFKKEEVGDE